MKTDSEPYCDTDSCVCVCVSVCVSFKLVLPGSQRWSLFEYLPAALRDFKI